MKIHLRLKLTPKFYKIANKTVIDGFKNMKVSSEFMTKQFKKLDLYYNTFIKDDNTDFALFNQSYLYHLRLFNELSNIH